MNSDAEFLRYAVKKLDQLCGRIEDCIGLLTPEQVWHRGTEEENAVGNLMLHLTGNVRQWILSGIGGAPNARVRDAEFSARSGPSPADMCKALRETVDQANDLIRTLPHRRLMDRMTIQGHDVTVLEAIFHVVEHFSGHAGQIIFMTKMFTGRGLGFYSYLDKPGASAGRVP